jgi:hypothetical protein
MSMLEPGQGSAVREPIVGWRLWRLGEGELRSWGLNYGWVPGVNDARCLAPLGRFALHRAPGEGCSCGFWGLFGPVGCLQLVHDLYGSETIVLGLMRAWGEIAVHGREGFRAQHAAVACLFSDGIPLVVPDARHHPVGPTGLPAPSCPDAVPGPRDQVLRPVADRFGVPLLAMRAAAEHGVLEELGADGQAMHAVDTWMADRARERWG